MEIYNILDEHVAEAMYWFVSQPNEYIKFECANIDNDVSIAEYCVLRFSTFKSYCEETFGFSICEEEV